MALGFQSGIPKDINLPVASVEKACGATLKIHWPTEIFTGVLWERVAFSSRGLLLTMLL